MVDDETCEGAKGPGANRRSAAAGSTQSDQVCALSFRELAYYVAGIALELPRRDPRRYPSRHLFRFCERLGTRDDLRVRELALAARREIVTTRSSRRQLEPGPRPCAMDENEEQLGLTKPEDARERVEKPFGVEAVHQHDYSQHVQPILRPLIGS